MTNQYFKEEPIMLKRIFAAISALLTILFAALGVQWIDRSRKNHWDPLTPAASMRS